MTGLAPGPAARWLLSVGPTLERFRREDDAMGKTTDERLLVEAYRALKAVLDNTEMRERGHIYYEQALIALTAEIGERHTGEVRA